MNCPHQRLKELRPILAGGREDGAIYMATPVEQLGDFGLMAGTMFARRLHWCVDCGCLTDDRGVPVFVPGRE